jgi:hypothetical protein
MRIDLDHRASEDGNRAGQLGTRGPTSLAKSRSKKCLQKRGEFVPAHLISRTARTGTVKAGPR